jgi:hypothetical protein
MAHKCLDNGTAYEVAGGKVRDNGTSYAISHGKINSSGTVYEIPFSSGTPVSELSVGSTIKMTVNGAAKEFIVVHQGKPSSIYDDSCNGTWVLMRDIYEKRAWHSSNSNSYSGSTTHSYLNSTFVGLFDANTRAIIKEVKIPYRKNSGYSTSVTSGSSGLVAKIFLLSGVEVNWGSTTSSVFPNDGACLSYFSGCDNSKRVAYFNGSSTSWWTRSPYCNSTTGSGNAILVHLSGSWDHKKTSTTQGIRPALVLTSDACVDENFNIIA